MAQRRPSDSRLVYSTDGGRLCPQCRRPAADCLCRTRAAAPAGDGIVRLHRESKGRGGKAVTVIRGLPLAPQEMKQLARELKQRCGTGGAVKGDTIEIQGDRREALREELERRGYKVKLAGG